MIMRLLKLFLAPVIGISGAIVFFMIFLTPAQRDAIFSEALSKLPIVRNFVTKTYDTHIYGLNFKDASDLKTATWAVDQLVLLEKKKKDGKERKYYALYPYVIEAGFDLSKVKIEEKTGGKELRLIMPPVQIVNVDVDQKKGLTFIRDSLEGDYEEALQPVRVGYHRFVRDLAHQSNLLENARQSATQYFQTFWKDFYEKVDVVHSPWVTPFLTVNMKQIPLQIRYSKGQKTNWKFEQEKYFTNYDTSIKTDSGSIFIGLSQEFEGTYRNLSDYVRDKLDVESTFINSFHPYDPRESSWLGWIRNGEFTGFKLYHGDLYYILSRGDDAEQAKNVCADGIYLFSNAVYNRDAKLNQKYKEYMKLVNEARIAADAGKLGTLSAISGKMIQLDETAKLSKIIAAITATLREKAFYATGDSDIDIYLKAWLSTHRQPLDKETRTNLLKLMKADSGIYIKTRFATQGEFLGKEIQDDQKKWIKSQSASYYKYVYANSERLGIAKEEKSEARTYLIENWELSRQVFESLDRDGLRDLFENWVGNKVSSFHEKYGKGEKKDEFLGRGLFSNIDAEGNRDYRSTGYPFFDISALENLHKKDKNKAYRLIEKCLRSCSRDIDDYFVVVITRKWLFGRYYNEYDAFLFGPDHLVLIKHIEGNDGIVENPKLYLFEKYEKLSPGADNITLSGETYKNTTLFYLLESLHSAFRKTKGENVTVEFEKLMRFWIYNKLADMMRYPRVDDMS